MLGRVRAALADTAVVPDVPREYRTAGARSRQEVVELFVERVRDYRAAVVVTDDPQAAVAAAFPSTGRRGSVSPSTSSPPCDQPVSSSSKTSAVAA